MKPTVTRIKANPFKPTSKTIAFKATLGEVDATAPTEKEAIAACEAKALRILSESSEPAVIHVGACDTIVVYRVVDGDWGYFFARGPLAEVCQGHGYRFGNGLGRKEAIEYALKHAVQYISN